MSGTIARKTGSLHVHVFGLRPVCAITADFSVVYRPGFLKHDSPVHDSPVMIRLRGYHSSTNFVNDEILSINIRLFSTKFKVKTLVAFI